MGLNTLGSYESQEQLQNQQEQEVNAALETIFDNPDLLSEALDRVADNLPDMQDVLNSLPANLRDQFQHVLDGLVSVQIDTPVDTTPVQVDVPPSVDLSPVTDVVPDVVSDNFDEPQDVDGNMDDIDPQDIGPDAQAVFDVPVTKVDRGPLFTQSVDAQNQPTQVSKLGQAPQQLAVSPALLADFRRFGQDMLAAHPQSHDQREAFLDFKKTLVQSMFGNEDFVNTVGPNIVQDIMLS